MQYLYGSTYSLWGGTPDAELCQQGRAGVVTFVCGSMNAVVLFNQIGYSCYSYNFTGYLKSACAPAAALTGAALTLAQQFNTTNSLAYNQPGFISSGTQLSGITAP